MSKDKKNTMNFLSGFRKEVDKMEDIGTDSLPPRYWISSGNYVQNYIMSGSFKSAIPQGRIVNFCGPSGAGKSFNIATACAAAQREHDAFVLAIDSENALDDNYMSGCGVDVSNERYMYADAIAIPQVTKLVSTFLKQYEAEYGDDPDAPKVLIVIDSLDMLMTETEFENFRKGVQKGDQGQRNRQLKAMLRSFVQAIKHLNVSIIVASQVYKNQDVTNGEGVWIVGEAVKYAASIIALVTKLKLREGTDIRGIRMKVEGYKTRFTKPFQTVTVHVDYEKGIDATSGLAEVAVNLGVLEKRGSRLAFVGDDKTFFEKDINDHLDRLLAALDLQVAGKKDIFLKTDTSNVTEDSGEKESASARRKRLAAESEAEESA